MISGADDLSLPKATVQKITTEILQSSPGVAFAKDARDLLIDCCVEFIKLISSEANDIAEGEAKKTIATEHIDKALRELGFPEYVQEVLASAGEHKETLKGHVKRKNKGNPGGATDEELAAQQMALFAHATEKYNQGTAA
ncbi:MAG: hypothetical protein L6R40_000607 [Gallowayella cf. fulva]|nr:MAG: hypothetical protein L6R40_000607 [Xanthomendoza cf. fulva]